MPRAMSRESLIRSIQGSSSLLLANSSSKVPPLMYQITDDEKKKPILYHNCFTAKSYVILWFFFPQGFFYPDLSSKDFWSNVKNVSCCNNISQAFFSTDLEILSIKKKKNSFNSFQKKLSTKSSFSLIYFFHPAKQVIQTGIVKLKACVKLFFLCKTEYPMFFQLFVTIKFNAFILSFICYCKI